MQHRSDDNCAGVGSLLCLMTNVATVRSPASRELGLYALVAEALERKRPKSQAFRHAGVTQLAKLCQVVFGYRFGVRSQE